jgi:hypothetical protein
MLFLLMLSAMLMSASLVSASITNGGFETGDFSGWTTVNGNVAVVSLEYLGGTQFKAYEGTSMARIGSSDAPKNWFYRNVLDQDTAKLKTLTFSYNFWTFDATKPANSAFKVLVNGVEAFNVVAPGTGTAGSIYSTGWLTKSLDLSAYEADSQGNITIAFSAGNITNNVYKSGVYLDAVSATHAPIPAAVWLLGSGLLGLFGIRKRFNK